MFVYPADLALVRDATAPGSASRPASTGPAGAEIRDRIFGRIDPISARRPRLAGRRNPNVTLFEEHARFVDVRTLDTGTGETITADQVVIAAGSRPVVPDVEGLDEVGYHTSDTVMRLDELPERLLILGGGFVAAEFAHVFGSFGTRVTIVNRSAALLRSAGRGDLRAVHRARRSDRWDVRLDSGGGPRSSGTTAGSARTSRDGSTVEADAAAGRDRPTLQRRRARPGPHRCRGRRRGRRRRRRAPADHRRRASGRSATSPTTSSSSTSRTTRPGSSSTTCCTSTTRRAWRGARDAVPSAVFSSPQVASVGLTEQDAVAQGVEHVVAHQDYGDTAYGWAMEDTTGFAKLLADPDTGLILGAHFLGPAGLQPGAAPGAGDDLRADRARGRPRSSTGSTRR